MVNVEAPRSATATRRRILAAGATLTGNGLVAACGTATQAQSSAQPAPKKLALQKETLRRLTPTELRLAAGGFRSGGCHY